jgi:hypothetical protein
MNDMAHFYCGGACDQQAKAANPNNATNPTSTAHPTNPANSTSVPTNAERSTNYRAPAQAQTEVPVIHPTQATGASAEAKQVFQQDNTNNTSNAPKPEEKTKSVVPNRQNVIQEVSTVPNWMMGQEMSKAMAKGQGVEETKGEINKNVHFEGREILKDELKSFVQKEYEKRAKAANNLSDRVLKAEEELRRLKLACENEKGQCDALKRVFDYLIQK